MNRGKVAGSETSSGTGKRQKGLRLRLYMLALSLLVVGAGVGLAVYFSQGRGSSQAASTPSQAGPLRLAVVGQPAPGFSLMDQTGQPYTLSPGDGKNHLLVFYMGYF